MIKIDSLNSSKGILKIFVLIDGKKEEIDNNNEINFYTIILNKYEISNEYHDISFILLNNIEVNISIKIRNVIGGKGFAERMNMFKKQSNCQSEIHTGIISTGVSMKDRLNFFRTKFSENTEIKPKSQLISKKIKTPDELKIKISSNLSTNNKTDIKENKPEKKVSSDIKEEEITENIENENKENNIEENKNEKEKINEEIKVHEKKEEHCISTNNEKNKDNKSLEKEDDISTKKFEKIEEIHQEEKPKENIINGENIIDKKEENIYLEEKEEIKNKQLEENIVEGNKEEEKEKEEIISEERKGDVNEEKKIEEKKEDEKLKTKNEIENEEEKEPKSEKENKNSEDTEKNHGQLVEENNNENKEELNEQENNNENKEELNDQENNNENKEEINEQENNNENIEEINEQGQEPEQENNDEEEYIYKDEWEYEDDSNSENINFEIQGNNYENSVIEEESQNTDENEEQINDNTNQEEKEDNQKETNNESKNNKNQENKEIIKEEKNEDFNKEDNNGPSNIENNESQNEAEKENQQENDEKIENEEEKEEKKDNNKEDNIQKKIEEKTEENIELCLNINKLEENKNIENQENINVITKVKEINKEEIQETNKKKDKIIKETVNDKKEKEIKKPGIERQKPLPANKRLSAMLPNLNFNNNNDTKTKKEEKNPKPKKLDNKFLMMMGQKFIGQYIKKPNEIQLEKDVQNQKSEITQIKNEAMLIESKTVRDKDINNQLDIKTIQNKEHRKSMEDKHKNKNKFDFASDFEILETYDDNNFIQPSSTMNTSMDSSFPENTLESVNYEKYLSELKLSGIKELPHERFCEGFFLASFPEENGQVIENSSKFPASCGHKDCSELPSMKPEIILRYPLTDTQNLELNNLAATICFPTGIKICFDEKEKPKQIMDYITQITNQKGERYYMTTFHFYKKMQNNIFLSKYKSNPLKHHLSKFTEAFLYLRDEEYTEEITAKIQNKLEFCQNLANREYVYIPCCLCLISKYPYTLEIEKCLDTIYNIMKANQSELNFEINDLIMYLINSIPIPDKNMRVQFYIPFCNNPKIELQCPKVDDIFIMNSNFLGLFKYLSVDNIIRIYRLILSEKKILFIHDDYTELTNITNSFISLLYPFQWIHTYIPIMSDQMLKYLETFLPFINGIHVSLMKLVEQVFKEGEIDDSEDVFLIYIKNDEIQLSSSFKKSKNKIKNYIHENIPHIPFEKELKKELKNIESSKKQQKREILENKFREAFINVFVKMFYDYEKYIVNLDHDVIFNKVLFMQNIPNKEDKEKIEQFYDEFIDSQLFQQFTQNIYSTDNSYFKKKIKEYKERDNKSSKKNDNEINTISNPIKQKEIIYLATPYIGLKGKDENNIETIIENYKISEKENDEEKIKILFKEFKIDPNKYINSNCTIYLTPENLKIKEKAKVEDNIPKGRMTIMGEMTEKQIDAIKENIKDIVINIFKSQIEKGENKTLKKKIFNNLETPEGRKFFVYLMYNNNNNIKSLQNNSFIFLEELIRGILNSALKSEETDELIEEIVKLILSTKFFETDLENENKSSKDKNINHTTIFINMKKFWRSYSKITQENLWKKWYEIELKRKNDINVDISVIKEEIVLDICKNLIFLEISKSTVKNITESINKIAFQEGFENHEKIKNKYTDLILKANYISRVNDF